MLLTFDSIIMLIITIRFYVLIRHFFEVKKTHLRHDFLDFSFICFVLTFFWMEVKNGGN
jgi:hypothetical protein